jgi:hypothetical protein
MQPVVEVRVLTGGHIEDEEKGDSEQDPAHGIARLMPGHDHTDHAEGQVQPGLTETGEVELVSHRAHRRC